MNFSLHQILYGVIVLESILLLIAGYNLMQPAKTEEKKHEPSPFFTVNVQYLEHPVQQQLAPNHMVPKAPHSSSEVQPVKETYNNELKPSPVEPTKTETPKSEPAKSEPSQPPAPVVKKDASKAAAGNGKPKDLMDELKNKLNGKTDNARSLLSSTDRNKPRGKPELKEQEQPVSVAPAPAQKAKEKNPSNDVAIAKTPEVPKVKTPSEIQKDPVGNQQPSSGAEGTTSASQPSSSAEDISKLSLIEAENKLNELVKEVGNARMSGTADSESSLLIQCGSSKVE